MGSNLVERLRTFNIPACVEAADYIEALEAQARDRMEFQYKQSQLSVKDMKRIMELEAALKPFADASGGLEPRDYDARVVAWIGNAEPNNGGAYGLHASDFRRAASLLEAKS